MRPSCLNCVRKHLAEAEIYLTESKLGYDRHFWMAIGSMSHACAESIRDYPELALVLRNEYKLLEEDPDYQIPILDLIDAVTEVAEKEMADAKPTGKKSGSKGVRWKK